MNIMQVICLIEADTFTCVMFLPATILLALAASGAQASRRNYGMGMNFGKG